MQKPGSLIQIPSTKPASPWTWELSTTLPRDQIDSGRTQILIPWPCLIVGCHVTVVDASAIGGLLHPSARDIAVLLDGDETLRFTAKEQTSNTARDTAYVTLESLDSEFRDLLIELRAPRPSIGATFRWKVNDPLVPTFESALPALSFFIRPLQAGET